MTLYVLLTGRFPFSWPEDVVPGDSHATKVQRMFARITAGSYMPMTEVSSHGVPAAALLPWLSTDCSSSLQHRAVPWRWSPC